MQRDLAPMRGIAMLDQVYCLPGAKYHCAALNRQAKRGRRQHCLDVGRHIVRPFHAMPVAAASWRDALQRVRKVAQHVGVGILLDGERR